MAYYRRQHNVTSHGSLFEDPTIEVLTLRPEELHCRHTQKICQRSRHFESVVEDSQIQRCE